MLCIFELFQEVPKLLARFFKMMRTKDGQVYNASSYTAYLCCVTRYLADAFHPPLDVKNDPAFKILRTMVKRMKASAQGTRGKKPGDNASRVVAARHLKQAWDSGDLGRQSPDALAAATQLDFVCLGNRRQCPFGFLATIPHVSYIFRKLMTNGIQWWVVHDILGSLGGH